jgi:concentrative nucleoside transporter, CNT family
VAQTGAYFAFNVLPTIIFFSSLMSVLYYLGVMQLLVKGLAWVMQKTLGTSGAETLSASGNIFLGQTESPLLIKPFVGTMTKSELNTVMVGGFATSPAACSRRTWACSRAGSRASRATCSPRA